MTRLTRPETAWLAAVALLAALIYLPGLGNPLLFDDAYLADGSLFADYASATQARARWLSYGSFVWIRALAGDAWWVQRLFNVLLHVAVVGALWALYREVLRAITVSGEAAAAGPAHQSAALMLGVGFFALNPVAVYAVAYLIQRSIVMATLFTVLALWMVARGVRTRRWGWGAGAVACYVLAIASKEHAIFAPLAVLPLYVLVARPSGKHIAAVAGAGAVLAGIAGWLLWSRYGEIIGTPFDEFSRVYIAQLGALSPDAPRHAFALSIENQAWLFFQYGLRWMLPAAAWMSINLRPPFPVTFATFPHLLGAIAFVVVAIAAVVAILRYRDWRALLGFAVLTPQLLFLSEFLTVWVQDPFVLYRSYLWAIGIPGLVYCLVNGVSAKAGALAGAALAVALGWQAVDRVLSMDSAERAWSDAIAKLPDDPRSVGRWFPYLNRGTAYVDRDELTLALRDFDSSSRLGDMGLGIFNAGAVMAAQGKHEEALRAFDAANKQGYDGYNVHFQRALSLAALNRLPEAYAEFRAARQMNPPSPTRELALVHLGRIGIQLGRNDEAAQDLAALLAVDPRHKEGRYLTAMNALARKEPQRALEILTPLVQEDGSAPAYYGRAVANFNLKRKAEALADIESAIRRDPRNAQLQEWRARIRAMPAN